MRVFLDAFEFAIDTGFTVTMISFDVMHTEKDSIGYDLVYELFSNAFCSLNVKRLLHDYHFIVCIDQRTDIDIALHTKQTIRSMFRYYR
jgi:hypothetical protein